MHNYVLNLAVIKQIRLLILTKDANGVQIQQIRNLPFFQPKRRHDWLVDSHADTDAKYFSFNNDNNLF